MTKVKVRFKHKVAKQIQKELDDGWRFFDKFR